jgi:hypothetical protein
MVGDLFDHPQVSIATIIEAVEALRARRAAPAEDPSSSRWPATTTAAAS